MNNEELKDLAQELSGMGVFHGLIIGLLGGTMAWYGVMEIMNNLDAWNKVSK